MVENVFVCSALVSLYTKCLSVREARVVFDLMPHRDVVSWNGVLTAYFKNKEYEKGFSLFLKMSRDGVRADEATWNAWMHGERTNRGGSGDAQEDAKNGI
jgi:pentatricopeptide repeat protein